MRISADKHDPGYVADHWAYRVFFDGVERSDVITADEEKRYILAQVLDQDGRAVIDRAKGAFKTIELWGTVRVERREQYSGGVNTNSMAGYVAAGVAKW